MPTISCHLIAILAFAMNATCGAASEAQPPILLKADLRDAPRKLLHATEIIPVKAGPMTLAYPPWLPSVHLAGPVDQQAGLPIVAHQHGIAAATPIRRERDPAELYLNHIVKGASSIEVSTGFITAADATTPRSTGAYLMGEMAAHGMQCPLWVADSAGRKRTLLLQVLKYLRRR